MIVERVNDICIQVTLSSGQKFYVAENEIYKNSFYIGVYNSSKINLRSSDSSVCYLEIIE